MTVTNRRRSGAAPARRLADVRGALDGPTFVAVGSLHGNEPSGIDAIHRLVAELSARRDRLRGRFVALCGNRAAFAAGRRFIARDLNRRWTEELLGPLLDQDAADLKDEDREQAELAAELLAIERDCNGPLYLLDMHSTSGQGAPFVGMADTLRNRAIAFAIPAPVILGLEETIDGSMLGWLSDRGHITVAFEGGQHLAPSTIDYHVAALWLAIVAAGLLDGADADDLTGQRTRLEGAARDLPPVVEIRHRHVIKAGDDYQMCAGFRNFQSVRAGELLARDRHGDVRAPESGRVLMPLYQSQGEDGYFLVREVRPLWLRLSALLRRGGFDRLVPLLPGVRAHPDLHDHYLVDPHLARFMVQEIFHLFGYRRRRPEGDRFVFSRRSPNEMAMERPL